MTYFHSLISQSLQRSRESTMGLLGIRDGGLREHVRGLFADEPGGAGDSLLGSPVFEHTFGWEQEVRQFGDLAGNLLSSELVSALAAPGPHQFSADSTPYCHQLVAWQALLGDEPRSVAITSGTGSGKTECFMVPILEDLVRERKQSGKLEGVRALFLYPLNALINSQRERLDAWTRPFVGDIRFCLYNGNTRERVADVRKEQAEQPNEVLSRELLRREPAPILMTNATMLEYMMIRQVDSPIIEQSRKCGSLRWIVLDEAHTYVGSQAAELSLLLRRVVQAFGKRPDEIRFVATSATIADGEAREKLTKYLAGLACVPETQVVVIGGRRSVPALPAIGATGRESLQRILEIDPGQVASSTRYQALAAHQLARAIRDFIVGRDTPAQLDEIVGHVAAGLTESTEKQRKFEVLAWIDVMTATANALDGEYFLKVRGHLFQRVLNGLWACVDPQCQAKPEALNAWAFGNVYAAQRGSCECGAPVCELAFCNDCKAPHLLAEDAGGVLRQVTPDATDEFAIVEESFSESDEGSEESETAADRSRNVLRLAPSAAGSDRYVVQLVGRDDHRIGLTKGERVFPIAICAQEDAVCWECQSPPRNGMDFLRGAHLGAPFYLTGIVPTVLEFCPDPSKGDAGGRSPEELPGRGRRVITFTDSRQGTARMAVRMQQEAERSRLRGLVFETIRNAQSASDAGFEQAGKSPEELEEGARILRGLGMAGPAAVAEHQAAAIRAGGGALPRTEVAWRDVAAGLAASSDLRSITEYNRHANPMLFSGHAGELVMAELLLAREFYRRPKNQNSSETLGLIRVGYRGLGEIDLTPPEWNGRLADAAGGGQRPLDIEDWRDFLKVALDFHVRENSFIAFLPVMREWMGSRFMPKKLMAPNADIVESSTVKKWPHVRPGQPSRLIKILEAATGLDRTQRDQADLIDAWLRGAWFALVNARILVSSEGSYALSNEALTFSLPTRAWLCAVTRRLIDTTLRGVSPYLPRHFNVDDFRCEAVELAKTVKFAPSGESEGVSAVVRQLVAADQVVASLRSQGLWTDLCDRTTEGGYYYRTAEHSAQQDATRLQTYERMFKEGRINALNCSTTMEMGVDIGGVSAVVMNNVPPHPANYLQRAGRAGRRGESRAIAYTLCKANPREMRVFRNSTWPFVTKIAAPIVTLSSDRIVARHVHSMLLAQFLVGLDTEGDRTKLNLNWFFGGESERIDEKFAAFLTEPPALIPGKIRELTRGTALSDRSASAICEAAVGHIQRIGDAWRSERSKLVALVAQAAEGPYRRALERELKRLEDEYLLRDLCARSFLPGYGFPTDVVTINTANKVDYQAQRAHRESGSREDNRFSSREMPSRSLDIAIREYAPGSQLVIDGRVFRSAGLSLQWHAGGSINEAQRFDISWRCRNCGSTGLVEHAYANESEISCTTCGAKDRMLERDKVLRPAGFLTDFFADMTNDVSSQKFVPVQEPRVSVRGEAVALPDARCGYLVFGHEGHVFHHSRGEHEAGFAVCMACGRADSMLGPDNPPASLRAGTTHWPLRGGRGLAEATCSAEAVMRNVHLGYQFLTDVLEVYLKSPRSGEWMGTGEKSKVVAATLGLALRESLTASLGIASTEIDFAIRQDKDHQTGRARTVIQLFDRVSGGAGFVLAGVTDIADILRDARSRLECPVGCDTVCTSCLAGNDNQVERRTLDRHLAMAWFDESGIAEHLHLPDQFAAISGARYCSLDGRRFVAARVNEGVSALTFFLHGDPTDWDLSHPEFRARLLRWCLVDGVQVELAVPEGSALGPEVRAALAGLVEAGLKVASYSRPSGVAIALVQARGERGIRTLYSDHKDLAVPGEQWFAGTPGALLVMSDSSEQLRTVPMDTAVWNQVPAGVVKLRIARELDGAVGEFGTRLLRMLAKEAPRALEQLKHRDLESVRYSDRYMKSPWTVLLLGDILRALTEGAAVPLIVEAIKGQPSNYSRGRINNDWTMPATQTATMQAWLAKIGFSTVEVKLALSAKDMPHYRQLALKYRSGTELVFDFDQGMGYWNAKLDQPFDRFNEDGTSAQRAAEMQRAHDKARVVGAGVSYTPVYVEVRRSR
ncbi:MAG: DEAD/DEAH box helicase [Lysobacterales bacterium]